METAVLTQNSWKDISTEDKDLLTHQHMGELAWIRDDKIEATAPDEESMISIIVNSKYKGEGIVLEVGKQFEVFDIGL